MRAGAAALIALALSALFIHDQLLMTSLRGETAIKLAPYPVFGDAIPQALRTWLDLPAYWLVLLVFAFPAFFIAGLVTLVVLLRQPPLNEDRRRAVVAFGCVVAACLCVTWLLASTLGENNDLGWRCVLPAVLLLIVLAAAGLSRAAASGQPALVAAGIVGVALGLPHGVSLIRSNVTASTQQPSPVFAASAMMWQAVRRHAGTAERIANNPDFLRAMTPWPVNISWALLANRRSCYAGIELVQPFAPLAPERRAAIDALFKRVFAGAGSDADLASLASDFDCRLVVLAAQDGAWRSDPFAAHPRFRLVDEKPDAWRLYRIEAAPSR
jgi:hypothetical protein